MRKGKKTEAFEKKSKAVGATSSIPKEEEEALFLGSDREYPPEPEDWANVELEAGSIWQSLVEPTKPPTEAAQRALKDCNRRVAR